MNIFKKFFLEKQHSFYGERRGVKNELNGKNIKGYIIIKQVIKVLNKF